MKRKVLFLLNILFFTTTLFAQEEVKLMSYNLLNYPNVDTLERNPHFRTIMADVKPDILVVQEMTSQLGVDIFLNNVMNSFGVAYDKGIFIDGYDSDNAIFFKTTHFTFVSNTQIKTALRDINEFKLVHKTALDTIRIISVHLKASSGTANETLRAAEVDTLRKYTNSLPAGTNFVVCGDMNLYKSNESAYQKLLAVTAPFEGHVIDPITMTGTWNSTSYAGYHTQSPRTRSFGGGITGGLDDRFDLILYSKAISQTGTINFVANSTVALGNDGNHYNDSINKQPNTAVSVAMANALHYASDHLPVIALFEFTNAHNTGIVKKKKESEIESKIEVVPNPFYTSVQFKFSLIEKSDVSFCVFNLLGQKIFIQQLEQLTEGVHELSFTPSANDNGGIYFYAIETNSFFEKGKLVLLK